MEEQVPQEVKKDSKLVKGLKIFSTALDVLGKGCSLVKSPIMAGVSLIANIGGFVAGVIADGFELSSSLEPEPVVSR
jgi:hypothetical protein